MNERLDKVSKKKKKSAYYIFSFVAVAILAFLFAFPLYWIITGAFKTKAEVMSTSPVWFPSEWVLKNFETLMDKRSAPLFDMAFGGWMISGIKMRF